MFFKNLKIRTKLFIIVTFLLSIVFVVVYFFGSYVLDDFLQEFSIHGTEDAQELFNTLVDRDIHVLSSALDIFLQDQNFKNIFLEKDREELYREGQDLFQQLKEGYDITHFYFHLPDGTNFVRMHNKDIYGDKINRLTFLESKRLNGLGGGIELGKTAYALRAVMPYYNEGELIGYVEFGQEIDHFLEILKEQAEGEFVIIAEKKYLNREDWQSVRRTSGLRDNWDDLKDYVIVTETVGGSLEDKCFTEKSATIAKKEGVFVKRFDDEGRGYFICGAFPIFDPLNENIGSVVFLSDITHFTEGITTSIFLFPVVFLMISVLVFFLANLFMSKIIINSIYKIRDVAVQISQGKMGDKVEIETKDEMGDLARSFNIMVTAIETSKKEIRQRVKQLEEQQGKVGNQQSAILNILEDVEEEKEKTEVLAEKLKIANEQLKKLDKMKSEFVSVASHQLRTPLTGIQWVAERMLKKSELSKEDKEYVEDMRFSANRLALLVNDLLNISRIEEGRISITPEKIDMLKYMQDYIKESSLVAEKRGVKITFEKYPEELIISADRNAIRNTVQSVISNAIEYTVSGGAVKVYLEKKGKNFLMKVSDTGIGIPKKDQNAIFKKFKRGSNAVTVKTDGTGLGLYIVQRTLELLGGKIWFESVENKGTTFFVELPLKSKKVEGEKGLA